LQVYCLWLTQFSVLGSGTKKPCWGFVIPAISADRQTTWVYPGWLARPAEFGRFLPFIIVGFSSFEAAGRDGHLPVFSRGAKNGAECTYAHFLRLLFNTASLQNIVLSRKMA
jgi:hypothetical protein